MADLALDAITAAVTDRREASARARIHRLALGPLLWLFLGLLRGLPAHAAQAYTLGVVPQYNARQTYSTWHPLITEVGRRSGLELQLQAAADMPAFEGLLNAGQLDFAYVNPYQALQADAAHGYVPLVRDHGRALNGIVVTRSGSGIADIAQLASQRIAFPSPTALGATLLIHRDLTCLHGIPFEPWYVGNHDSVYLNVALGRAVAGGGVVQTLEEQPPEIRERLRIIYKTAGSPTHALIAHPRVPAEVRQQITGAFLAMARHAKGRKLLQAIPIDEIGTASSTDYYPLLHLSMDAPCQ